MARVADRSSNFVVPIGHTAYPGPGTHWLHSDLNVNTVSAWLGPVQPHRQFSTPITRTASSITDFKTGQEKPWHKFQVMTLLCDALPKASYAT